MLDKSKKNKHEKVTITKQSLYSKPLSSLIQSAILLALFICGLILILRFFRQLPLWCSVLTVIVISVFILHFLCEFLASVNHLSKIKNSKIIITDAIVVNKYKKISNAVDDFSDDYYIKFKCTDESILEVEIDLCLYEKVTIGSSCYYLNISKSIYPKDYYLLGEDLLPFYKNNAE